MTKVQTIKTKTRLFRVKDYLYSNRYYTQAQLKYKDLQIIGFNKISIKVSKALVM